MARKKTKAKKGIANKTDPKANAKNVIAENSKKEKLTAAARKREKRN